MTGDDYSRSDAQKVCEVIGTAVESSSGSASQRASQVCDAALGALATVDEDIATGLILGWDAAHASCVAEWLLNFAEDDD